ncbi:MAG: hypothetical protein KAW92_11855 [Candidatus Cloacimonetes bacterium]|nr:hypothetical protein [Candidatus Cloacimonadota bacterium]
MIYDGLRSIFFGDQDVYKEDLNNVEYTKLKTIRDSLAACISQAGVAIESLASDGLKVSGSTVNPGTALDKYGRIIYVPSNTAASGSVASDPYYHPAWPSRTASGSGNYVNIYYDVQYDISENDDTGASHYTRAYDSYTILIEGSPPSDESGGICLASGGADCRPLLYLRSQTEAVPVVDEAWNKSRQANETLNNWVSNLYWYDSSGTNKKAEVAYKYSSDSSLMNIRFYVWNAVAPGTIQVDICDSLTESVIITNSVSFPAGSGYYDLSLSISSLSATSLYFIKISVSAGGGVYVGGVVIHIT